MFLRNVFKRLFKCLTKNMPSCCVRSALLRMAGYRIGSQVFIGEELIIRDGRSDWGMVTIGNRVAIAERPNVGLGQLEVFLPYLWRKKGF